MLIGNRLNPNSVINTDLVANYFKRNYGEKHKKPFTIEFGFSAAHSDDQIGLIWEFEKEEDRDAQWNNLMGAMSVQFFD